MRHELPGVELHPEAGVPRRLAHADRRVAVEADRVEADVDGVGEAAAADLPGQPADEVDIGGDIPGVLGGDGVAAEIGRRHRHREGLAEPPRDAEHPELGVAVEPVAGLDLDRGDALGHQHLKPLGGAREERVFRCGAGGGDGRSYAAARRGDLDIARAASRSSNSAERLPP